MLTLLVDIGNTRMKWRAVERAVGLADSDPAGALVHAKQPDLDALWQQLPLEDAWIVNVAGAEPLAAVHNTLSRKLSGAKIRRLRAQTRQAGVLNCYRDPEQLGADRWAMLIGARALYPGHNVLIASLGTATTIDLLVADGRFVGGVILPGIDLMRRALAHNTAALPLAIGDFDAFARNTDDAITSGILHAQAGAIERAARETGLLLLENPDAPARSNRILCLLAGGDAAVVQPRLPFYTAIADNLVLRGLLEVARETPAERADP